MLVMNKHPKKATPGSLLTIIFLSALVTACGGGGGNGQTQPPPPTHEIQFERGSLISYLNAIEYGAMDDNYFQIPTSTELSLFENIITLILGLNYQQANTLAHDIGFEIVNYTDTDSGKNYYMLREQYPVPSTITMAGGYYLFNPGAIYNVAVHVPHPKYDTFTNLEGIALFLNTDVKYLFLSGSHRRSSAIASSCQNTNDYRVSDPVHNIAHYFYIAHKALEDFDENHHVIELHGFGSSYLDQLNSQCDATDNSHLIHLSETRSDLNAGDESLMHTLESIVNSELHIAACIYSTVLDTGPDALYGTSLGATLNTPGRYTNGSTDACNTPALNDNNTHRYLHIEQSYNVRSLDRDLMINYINLSLIEYFSQ